MGKGASDIERLRDWLLGSYRIRINGYKLAPEYSPADDTHWYELDDFALNQMKLEARMAGFSRSQSNDIDLIVRSHTIPVVYELEEWLAELPGIGTAAKVTPQGWHMPTVKAYFDTLTLANPKHYDILLNLFMRWTVAAVNSGLRRKHNDVMLLLVGPQGIYKTSWLNNLVPEHLRTRFLFTGHITPSLTDNNTANYLAEKWIINIDDQLEIIFGKEYNSMKAIISTAQVTNRKVYARQDKTRPRIANFVGSVNSTEFLTDHQNRRYFIIEVTGISPDYADISIPHLWAEAVAVASQVQPLQVWTRSHYTDIDNISQGYNLVTSEEALLLQAYSPQPDIDTSRTQRFFATTSELLHLLQNRTRITLRRNALSAALSKNRFRQTSQRLQRLGKQSRKVWEVYASPDNVPVWAQNSDTSDDEEFIQVTNDDEVPF